MHFAIDGHVADRRRNYRDHAPAVAELRGRWVGRIGGSCSVNQFGGSVRPVFFVQSFFWAEAANLVCSI
jgi:hypothetical protein